MTTTIPRPTVSVSEIHDILSTFIASGQVVEIRVLKKHSRGAGAGYFNNLQKAAEAAAAWSGKAAGIYFVLNPFNPVLIARACNRMADGIPTTANTDITRRRYIYIDVDRNGPAGYSSTEEEHQAALTKVRQIHDYLVSIGFSPDSFILADSGNGGHLHIVVLLPNDEPTQILVENFLKALDFRFSDDKVHVDTGMANAARICKVYGTLAAKGDSIPDRPHRYSHLLSKPTTRVEAPRELIEAVAATLPHEPKEDPHVYHGNGKTFDLLAFIATHFPDARGPIPWNGGQKWIILVCPFNESHNRGEAYIGQFTSGAIAAGCHHNSCQHWDWRELRAKFDTYYRNRSNGRHQATAIPADVPTHEGGQLPLVNVGDRQLREPVTEVASILQKDNAISPFIYRRGGVLVRVGFNESSAPIIETLTEAALRGILTQHADFVVYHTKKDELIATAVSPPMDVVQTLLTLGEWPFPGLLGIMQTPIIQQDGSIFSKAGYDPESRLYYYPTPGLSVNVPESPTEADVKAATVIILEPLENFPFDGTASKANAVASIITPVIRTIIAGPVPLGIFDKPAQGTGASLLADVVNIVAIGSEAEMLTAPGHDNDDEWRKLILSVLLSGTAIVVIDNYTGRLDSSKLAATLTATSYKDRILGSSKTVAIPNHSCWFVTGNNIDLAGDMPRRSYWVRLDAKTARPWLRNPETFKHPNLKLWIKEKRGAILSAILTVARFWIQRGRPVNPKTPVLGSFESYCEVVGGVLHVMGVEAFLGNLDEMYAEADSDAQEWDAFTGMWLEINGGKGFTVSELADAINANETLRKLIPDTIRAKEGRDFNKVLGNELATKKDYRFGNGLRLMKTDKKRHHAAVWRLLRNDEGQGELELDNNRNSPSCEEHNSPATPQADTDTKGELGELQTTSLHHVCAPGDGGMGVENSLNSPVLSNVDRGVNKDAYFLPVQEQPPSGGYEPDGGPDWTLPADGQEVSRAALLARRDSLGRPAISARDGAISDLGKWLARYEDDMDLDELAIVWAFLDGGKA